MRVRPNIGFWGVLALALAGALVALTTWAADLPVSYMVDGKVLKDAVSGTNLTFELFDDSACTSLVHSETQSIDSVVALRLKRFKPPQGAKPPKTAEIRTTLTGVAASGNLYLKVTGTGVSPVGPACQAQAAHVAPPPSCFDNIQNQDETDVDCGGSTCSSRCETGDGCQVGSDCVGGVCSGNVCQATCTDGQQNQDETGVDCGGSLCPACFPGQGCGSDTDCFSPGGDPVHCLNGTCTQTCLDGVQDFGESDIDCGAVCEPISLCQPGQNCVTNNDCMSLVCLGGVCQ